MSGGVQLPGESKSAVPGVSPLLLPGSGKPAKPGLMFVQPHGKLKRGQRLETGSGNFHPHSTNGRKWLGANGDTAARRTYSGQTRTGGH